MSNQPSFLRGEAARGWSVRPRRATVADRALPIGIAGRHQHRITAAKGLLLRSSCQCNRGAFWDTASKALAIP
jgi:hypothetical protein